MSYNDLLILAYKLHEEVHEVTDMIKSSLLGTKSTKPVPDTPEPPDTSALLTGGEVQEILKICTRTLYNYRQQGILPGRKIGGKYLYKKEDMEKLIG